MTMLLMLTTVAAVGTAAVLAVLLARTKAAERERSEARVAALALAAGVAPRIEAFHPESAFVDEASGDEAPSSPAGLFQEPAAASPWTARLAIGGAVGLAAVGLLVGASLASSGAGQAAPTAGAAAAPGPLALRALDYSLGHATVTITGEVENDGPAAGGLVATAYLFAADGRFLASGRSPLDRSPLAPGAASRFTIEVPVRGAVARYRVSFRDATGRVVAHVDRRSGTATAAEHGSGEPS